MNGAAATYGVLACALLVAYSATFLPGGRKWPLAAGAAGLALTPFFAGESLATALHGMLGAPSPTLVQLLLWRLAPVFAVPLRRGVLSPAAAWTILGVAAVFYPLALGWGAFDPYGLGYRPWPLLLALLPLAAGLAWRRQDAWLLVLGVDLLAYATGLFGNLWDALIDPLLVLLALARLAALSRPGRR